MIDDTRICFLGDSFVQGLGDPEFRGWAGRALQACAADVTAYNLGVRRNTSTDVLHRCWAEVEARTVPGADHRLVVSVGSNDATESPSGGPRVPPDRTRANLAALLDGARDRGHGALVVGPPPVVMGGARQLERMLALVPLLAEVCAERAVPFVDVTRALAGNPAWVAEATAGDGAHPGAGGYAALAELVLAGGFRDWLLAGRADRAASAGSADRQTPTAPEPLATPGAPTAPESLAARPA
ncbi:GDSL-type esterase/lipase family protein [Kitasatospora sp. NPDC101176]|uniref:GDSL-type esterase/lipase family protein n=1 Tax=Kitasatospora sp. NPDC101176 TaxID=3364099 RepID=UPI0038294F8A